MTLGEKIVSLRRQAGLSQERLAGELGVSRQAVSRWETNSALPDAMNVLALSRLFGVSADYLRNDGFPAAGTSAAARDNRALRAADLAALLAGALWNLGLYVAGRFVNAGGQLISEFENGVKVTTHIEPLGYAGLVEAFGLEPLTAVSWALAALGLTLLLYLRLRRG